MLKRAGIVNVPGAPVLIINILYDNNNNNNNNNNNIDVSSSTISRTEPGPGVRGPGPGVRGPGSGGAGPGVRCAGPGVRGPGPGVRCPGSGVRGPDRFKRRGGLPNGPDWYLFFSFLLIEKDEQMCLLLTY